MYLNLLKDYQTRINSELKKFFSEKDQSVDARVRFMLDAIEEYTLRGGKRIRAILMILGHNTVAHENPDLITASTAMELVQSYLLIHDDIMDESDLRRGKPTLHMSMANENSRNPARFGESIGIIAGDLAEAYAHEILLSANFPAERLLKASLKMSEMVENTGYGQTMDLMSEVSDFGEEDVFFVHEYKTAKYTVEYPLLIGAILAGAGDDVLEKLSSYAVPAGIAFQLHDDVLGLFGTEETGKPVKADLAEGKKTLLIIKALEKASPEDRAFISHALGKRDISDSDVVRVQEIVKSTGSLDYSLSLEKTLVAQAKEAIKALRDTNPEVVDVLSWLADYMVSRTY